MTKMASEGQQKYIGDLLRIRAGGPKTCGDLHYSYGRHVVPYLAPDDWTVETWIDTLTFDHAKAILGFLVALPEPEHDRAGPDGDGEITPPQRSKCWALLKNLDYPTWNVWKLRQEDRDIPHVGEEHWEVKVWDWLTSLTRSQANDVIEHLEGVQKLLQR